MLTGLGVVVMAKWTKLAVGVWVMLTHRDFCISMTGRGSIERSETDAAMNDQLQHVRTSIFFVYNVLSDQLFIAASLAISSLVLLGRPHQPKNRSDSNASDLPVVQQSKCDNKASRLQASTNEKQRILHH